MELRDYQRADAKTMAAKACIGNFSEQRTGKTPTTCVSLANRGIKNVLIVCPASLTYVWKEAWEAWTGCDAFVLPTTSYDISKVPKTTAIVVNYEKLRGAKGKAPVCDALVRWNPGAVVVDEAHRMKDRKSLTAVQLMRFRHVPIRIALTGTPATNRPWDVWSILHWLFPDTYRSYWKFVEEYFYQETIWISGIPHNQPAGFKKGMESVLQHKLNDCCIQRKRSEVMQWLPEDEEPTIVKLPPTAEQLRAIDGLIKYFEYKDIVTQNILENLIRVRQVCAAPEILGLKSKSPKIEWLKQYLKDYPDKQCLVFSNSRKLIELVKRALEELNISTAIIAGGVPLKERSRIVSAFQNRAIKVVLCQTQACKEGLTLDEADVSIFLDTYPPSADYLQAKDRMVATTKEKNKPKELIHVMMKGTYDEQTFNLVKRNVDETAIINDYKNYVAERRKQVGK